MAKPRIPNQKKQYQLLNRRLAAYMAAVRRIYGELNSEAARIALSTGYDGKQPFAWKDYPATKARVRKLQERFVSQLGGLIMTGTSDEWKRSNLQQDLIVDKVLKAYHTSREDAANERYYRDNSEALQAFQQRKEQGMNLSDKLWDQSQAYREELQDTISAAIERGTDAITLSKQISKYLSDFPAMQRDYKEKYGKASKVQNCEYRSIRLARSEINMAYRSAEQQRWRQLDFVVGYEIKMSGSHPVHDVCDELAGKYPKDFVWNGWHPNCMCYEIPILKTEEEFYEVEEKKVTERVDAEKVEEALANEDERFETKLAFRNVYQSENETAKDKLAYQLGDYRNPQGEDEQIFIGDIIPTEKYLYSDRVLEMAEGMENGGIESYEEPTGIRVGDKVFVVKGHEYLSALSMSGTNTFWMNVVEVSEDDWIAAGGVIPEGGFINKKTSVNEVTDVPLTFKQWCVANEKRIALGDQHNTLPYFIADNRHYAFDAIENKTDIVELSREAAEEIRVESEPIFAANAVEADGIFREKTAEVWKGLSEQDRIWMNEYTQGSYEINDALRGGYDSEYEQIERMKSIIGSNSYDFDFYVTRNEDAYGIWKRFGIKLEELSQNGQLDSAIGAEGIEPAFLSTTSNMEGIEEGNVMIKLLVPRGTNCLYMEPFSAFGCDVRGDGSMNGRSGANWDGVKGQKKFGYESEILLQAGLKYRIVGIKQVDDVWHIDMEVVPK